MYIIVFGDSYVSRLEKYCDGNLRVPGTINFLGKGGLRACKLSNVPQYIDLLRSKSDVVFVHLGGNDISPTSNPHEIFDAIRRQIVTDLHGNGVRCIYVGQILPRSDFSKCPGLTKSCFERQRNRINYLLGNEYKDFFLKFKDIRCPRDYLPDGVHLKTDDVVKNRIGMKKYAERIRLVLCTVTLLTKQ